MGVLIVAPLFHFDTILFSVSDTYFYMLSHLPTTGILVRNQEPSLPWTNIIIMKSQTRNTHSNL